MATQVVRVDKENIHVEPQAMHLIDEVIVTLVYIRLSTKRTSRARQTAEGMSTMINATGDALSAAAGAF